MRCRRILYASSLALCCSVLSSSASADPPSGLAPIRVVADRQETITFSKLILRIKGSHDVGLAPESYRIGFLEKMRKLGYPALGAESLVFDQDKSDKARFAVGGTIQELDCTRLLGDTRECSIGILWELQDREDSHIAYRVLSRYSSSGSNPDQLGERLALGAFYSLLSRSAFVNAMRKQAQPGPQAPRYPTASFKACPAQRLEMPLRAEDALKATVLIEAAGKLGSGAVVSPDGLVLTAAHVVDGASSIAIQFRGGQRAQAKLVRINHRDDVALLKADWQDSLPCLSLRSQTMRIGEEVFAIGTPLSKELSFTLTRGIVSGIREMNGSSLLQTDASVNPGNSGGPLIDKNGEWAGLVSWKAVGRGVQGIAFAVPTQTTLGALSISSGETTQAILTQAIVEPSVQHAETIVDDPDAQIFLSRPGSIQHPSSGAPISDDTAAEEPQKAGQEGNNHAVAGLVLMGAGLGLGGFANLSKDIDGTSKKIMYGMAGLALAGGLVVLLLPSGPKTATTPDPLDARRRNTAPTLAAGIGVGSVGFYGSF